MVGGENRECVQTCYAFVEEDREIVDGGFQLNRRKGGFVMS